MPNDAPAPKLLPATHLSDKVTALREKLASSARNLIGTINQAADAEHGPHRARVVVDDLELIISQLTAAKAYAESIAEHAHAQRLANAKGKTSESTESVVEEAVAWLRTTHARLADAEAKVLRLSVGGSTSPGFFPAVAERDECKRAVTSAELALQHALRKAHDAEKGA